MNLRIITKNHAADPEKGFLKKSSSKPNGRATAMPTAWELKGVQKLSCFNLRKLNVQIFGGFRLERGVEGVLLDSSEKC